MSLSYRRAQRSSWCLGYDPSTSSTSSYSTTRPSSTYGSVLGSSRLDYGNSVSLGTSSRWSSTSSSTTSRGGLYTPASSISSRSTSSYGDAALRRSTYGSGGSSYSDSRSFSERSRGDIGQGFSSVDSGHRQDAEVSYRRRSSKTGETAADQVGTGEKSQDDKKSSTRRWSWRGEEESVRSAGAESSVEPATVVRRRERRRHAESGDNENKRSDRGKDTIESRHRRARCIESDTETVKVESDSKLDLSTSRQDDGDIFARKLATYVKDCDDKAASNKQCVNEISKNNMAHKEDNVPIEKPAISTSTKTEDEDPEERIELKQISLLSTSRSPRDSVKYTKSERSEKSESHTVSKVSQSTPVNGPSGGASGLTFKSFRQRSQDISDNTSLDKDIKPSDSGLSSVNTSSTGTLVSKSARIEENVPKKGYKTVDSTEGAGKNDGSCTADRKPRVNGTAKGTTTTSSTNHARTTSTSGSANQKEIVRLESLCESRTKELTHTKMQLKAATQGFDAMAILVNYCCAELNAFECPELAKKLETVQKQLTDCLSQIADLMAQKETLDRNLSQVTQEKEEVSKKVVEALSLVEQGKEEHAKRAQELDQTHNSALTTQRDELSTKHEEAVKKLHQYYDKQLELMKQSYERQMADMKNDTKLEMNGIRISHLEEIQELRNKHDSQMEELHKQHRNKLEDITHRFESIKMTLSEKVESLRGECDELRHRARNSEEALQRDADVKVQMALAPYLSLPKEIESLKTVLEMRNEEIQKLRSKNMDLEKQLEEIPIAREKIISLQQKVENLEAIINIKTDHEKQLHEKCQVLMRKYDRESKANKRLSMDYEQVMWRMSQSAEFGSTDSLIKRHLSRSPPRSEGGSPDPRRRALSPSEAAQNGVVMRVKKRSSHSVSEGDRRLRSRSATFVVEKTESSDSHSPSSSPQPKQKRWRKKSQTEDVVDESERMCYSAGAEILSESQHHRRGAEMGAHAMVEEPPGQMVASDMGSSYSKSLSGVSDSGVYDSMTRSDLLNSSIVSTDSEFGTSINLSMNLNSTLEDVESGPPAGDYNSLNNTTMSQTRESSSETDSGHTSSSNARNGSVSSSGQQQVTAEYYCEYSKPTSSTYQFQVSLTDDNVFTEELREKSHSTLTDTSSAKDS